MNFWPFPRRVALPAPQPAPRRASTALTPAYQDRRRREIAKALGKMGITP